MRIATWNLGWAKPGTARHDACVGHLELVDADIVVTTEHSVCLWEKYPHLIDAGADWGYPIVGDRRKVLAWSKTPWNSAAPGEVGATRGRLVSGRVAIDGLDVNLVAVCIPWRDAHVRSGRSDRKGWAEHHDFLDELEDTLARLGGPVIVAGDFNQRSPKGSQPRVVHDHLVRAVGSIEIATSGDFDGVGPLIDHVAISPELETVAVSAWPNDIGGTRLSDHSGVAVDLTASL